VLRWPALSKGLVLRAFGIRGSRGRRPMVCFLSFDMAKDPKGGPTSGGFLRYSEGQRASSYLVARDTGSLKWSIMRGRRSWSLVSVLRAALTHVFASARPTGSSAMACQVSRPRDHGIMGDL
jgi:hypothetical protein